MNQQACGLTGDSPFRVVIDIVLFGNTFKTKSRDRNDMIIDSFLKQVSGRSVGDNPTVSRLVIMLLAGLSGETDVYFAIVV